MKLSNILLVSLFLLLAIGMVASNYILKKEYDKIDKTDPYWKFKTICDKPFKHLKITGGNRGNVYFEPGNNSSAKTGNWEEKELLNIKAEVKNDTLFLNFPDTFMRRYTENGYYYSGTNSMVRITTKELLSVSGNNCRMLMGKMVQSNYQIKLSGKSDLKIQSINKAIENLNVLSSDSSLLSLDVSKEAKDKNNLSITNCSATLSEASRLSLPNAVIGNLRLKINDQSSVEISGYNMKRLKSEGDILVSR